MNAIDVKNNLAVNTFRGPSASIWGECPVADLQENPTLGMYFFDDFDRTPYAIGNNGEKLSGLWTTFVANSASALVGTAADTTNLPLEGGVWGMTAGSNNNLSISMAAAPSAYRLVSPASGYPLQGKLWFEMSMAVSTVTSGTFDLFVGLMDTGDAGTRITSAADLVFSAANAIKTTTGMGGCLGFWKRATTNPSDVAVVYNVNAGTAQNPGSTTLQKLASTYGSAAALAALSVTSGTPTGFRKFGFIYDPNAYPVQVATAVGSQTAGAVVKKLIRFFVDGLEVPVFLSSTELQAATFPTSFLAPVIGFRTGASGAGIAYVDFVRVAQMGSR